MPWGRPTIGIHELSHGVKLPSEETKIETIFNALPRDLYNKPIIIDNDDPNLNFVKQEEIR